MMVKDTSSVAVMPTHAKMPMDFNPLWPADSIAAQPASVVRVLAATAAPTERIAM